MPVSLSISSFKIMGKRIVAISIIGIIIIATLHRYMELVDGEHAAHLYDFYHHVDNYTIDVLCLGSSHVYCGINPVNMYDDYGIAAYNLAAGSQPVWFSYAYLKEVLKTQSPKLVILDVYTIVNSDEAFGGKVQMNILEMNPSVIKYNALKSAQVENWVDIWGIFPIYHMRYANINKDCYDNRDYCLLGCRPEWAVISYDSVEDVSLISERKAVSERSEEYLRRIIELCQTQGSEILLTNTPTPLINAEWQMYYNYVGDIAKEYGIAFINGCEYTEDIGLDYTTDCFESGHLNYYGVEKYTAWLEQYITAHYDLPDRRGMTGYDHWEAASERLKDILQYRERQGESDVVKYVESLCKDEDCYNVMLYNGVKDSISKELYTQLKEYGLKLNKPCIYVFKGNEIIFHAGLEKGYEYTDYLDKYIFHVKGESNTQTFSVDRNIVYSSEYKTSGSGAVPMVYIFTYNGSIGTKYSSGKEFLIN